MPAPTLAAPGQPAGHNHATHLGGNSQPGQASPDANSPEYIYEQEKKVLGEAHAKEHLQQRLAMAKAAKKKSIDKQRAAPPPGPPEQIGRFQTSTPIPSPDYGIHVVVLPTGKVLSFSFDEVTKDPNAETTPVATTGERNRGRAFLWDPAKGNEADAWKSVPPPIVTMPDETGEARPAPLFCTGMAFLPNGVLAVFGGNLALGHKISGATLVFTFDPWTEQWHRQQDLDTGRWYPSSFPTPSGRIGSVSGEDEAGMVTGKTQIFPARGTEVPGIGQRQAEGLPNEIAPMQLFTWDYPPTLTMGDGATYVLGRQSDHQFRVDTSSWSVQRLPQRPDALIRGYGPVVPLPGGAAGPTEALYSGGLGGNPQATEQDQTTVWRFDTKTQQWWYDSNRNLPRNNDTLTLLPDGSVLSVNGEAGPGQRNWGAGYKNPNDGDVRLKQVEIYDQNTKTWTLGPSSAQFRGYHSNAALLPDGRVLVTGDEYQQMVNDPNPNDNLLGSIEIYQPAMLFRGPRPTITSAPEVLGYGQQFTVRYQGEAPATRAVLVAPTAVTHTVNTTQRHVELQVESNADGELRLRAPANANAALPGYYMLFLLTEAGAPSVSVPVRFDVPTAPNPVTFTNQSLPTDLAGDRCVDAAGASSAPGTQLILWDCTGGPAQQITLSAEGRLHVGSGGCMDYGTNSPVNEAKVQIQPCGGNGQIWRYDTTTRAFVTANGLVLDVYSHNPNGGAILVVWERTSTANQQWSLNTNTKPANQMLHTDLPGSRCLDAAGGSDAPGTPLIIWDCNGNPAQRLTMDGDGRMHIGTGGCVDYGTDWPQAGTALTVQPCGGDGQIWSYNASTRLFRAKTNGLAIDVWYGNPDRGSRTVVWDVHGGRHQRWSLG